MQPSDSPAAFWVGSPACPGRGRRCGRGWTKDQRRGVFQIFNGAVLGAALALQIAKGFVAGEVFWLALLALPGTLVGARLGTWTYHALSDRNLYDIVLGLLFVSGLVL